MKKGLFIFMVLLLFSFTSYAKDEVVYDEAERTIKSLNEVRKELGLSEFTINSALSDMAESHSKYMSYNSVLSSVEDRTKEHYKGRYPWDRASYFSYDKKYVYEFIVGDINNFTTGINNIIADPMTRNIIFNPTYNEIGMSIQNSYSTFVIGGEGKTNKNTFITYPYDGQENVKSKVDAIVFKNYFKNKNLISENNVGMPITVTYIGTKIKDIKDIKIEFQDKKSGKKIDYMFLKASDYYFLENTLVVFPIHKYDYNTEYKIYISFKAELKSGEIKRFNKKITFKTDIYELKNKSEKYITRGEFVEKLVKNEKYKLIEPLEYKFSDVKVNDSLSKYIYTAAGKNLISGFENGRFESGLNITKEQVYTILLKAYLLKHDENIYVDEKILEKYDDYEDVSSWALSSLRQAEKIGIVIKAENKINPKAYITQSEYEKILEIFSKIK